MSGKVYLVGAGPGDPELITCKGARILAQADVVVYDFLANSQLLNLAPLQARKIYVGKKQGQHTMPQAEINQMLCDLGAAGLKVVRLKGGDPFVFGRGGEEASALHAAGIAFEVVPGVTSAVAAPAYAGIPITDRRHGPEVAFVTGHEDEAKKTSALNWKALAGLSTVVFLMGIKNLPEICRQLMAEGKSPDTPAAAVRWGATPRQETVQATLGTLAREVEKRNLTAPAVTIIGSVVNLRPELAWFEKLPLFGRRILVTRTREQAGALSLALREQGAEVLEIPAIALAPPPDAALLATALDRLPAYQWVIFTSPNGVKAFFKALHDRGQDSRAFAQAQVAAIGPATAAALRDYGLQPDLTAAVFKAEGLLDALADYDMTDRRVLIPRALEARQLLPETLLQRGAVVDVVPVYQTKAPDFAADLLASALTEGFDALTFTAGSTVHNLWVMLAESARRELLALNSEGKLTVAAIGPITARAAQEVGFTVQVQPDEYTIPALTKALAGYYVKTGS